MKKRIATTLSVILAVALLAILLALPSSAQDWDYSGGPGVIYVNDSPRLHGPRSSWWTVNPSGRHGTIHHGQYHFTYGDNNPNRTNWASWEFKRLGGSDRTYNVWVWVPDTTAKVRYNVRLQGCTNKLGTYRVLDQAKHSGWVKIGRVSLGHASRKTNRNITIEVNDNEIADSNEALNERKVGVDAMLLVRDRSIGWPIVNSDKLITDRNCYGATTTTTTPVTGLSPEFQIQELERDLQELERDFMVYQQCIEDESIDLWADIWTNYNALNTESDALWATNWLSMFRGGQIVTVITQIASKISPTLDNYEEISSTLLQRFSDCAPNRYGFHNILNRDNNGNCVSGNKRYDCSTPKTMIERWETVRGRDWPYHYNRVGNR